jgi:hypothetical protein
MKNFRITCPRVAGKIVTDESTVIVNAPNYWNKYIGKKMSVLITDLSIHGEVKIHYVLGGKNERYNEGSLRSKNRY